MMVWECPLISSQPGDVLDLAVRIRMYVPKGIWMRLSHGKSISQDIPYRMSHGLERGLR